MRPRSGITLAALFAALLGHDAGAQSLTPPANAAVRFKLTTSDSIHDAQLFGVTPDSIFFERCWGCARTDYAFTEFSRLDVKMRPPGSVAGRVVAGTAAGIVAGALV